MHAGRAGPGERCTPSAGTPHGSRAAPSAAAPQRDLVAGQISQLRAQILLVPLHHRDVVAFARVYPRAKPFILPRRRSFSGTEPACRDDRWNERYRPGRCGVGSAEDVRWSPLGRTAKLERGIVDHSGQGRGRSVPVTLLGTERGRCKIPSGSCHRTAAVRVPEPHWEAAVTAEEENVTPNLKRRSVVSTSSRKTGRSPNSARERRPVRPDNLIVPEGWHASMSGSRATWSSQRTATRTCRPTRSLRGQPGSPADSHRHRHQVRWVLPRRTRLFSTSRDPQPAWFVDAGRF